MTDSSLLFGYLYDFIQKNLHLEPLDKGVLNLHAFCRTAQSSKEG